jgi:hypothetical protein
MSARVRPLVLAALAAGLVAPACATPHVTVDRRADGIYHLSCPLNLPECLRAAEVLCEHRRYAVLRAFDEHDLRGDTTQPTDVRWSEAFVRCGFERSWDKDSSALHQQDLCPPAAAAAAPGPVRVCTPGATQACVGPAACQGGQACQPDGTHFSPCDCGPPGAAPAAPATPAP